LVRASTGSLLLGKYLVDNGRHVVLIDSNHKNIQLAQERGLEAINTDIYSETLSDNIELSDIGFLMALTGSADINKYAISKFSKQFGENGTFRLITADELSNGETIPKEGLFSQTIDYDLLTKVARQYPKINEIEIKDRAHYEILIEQINSDDTIVPLMVKDRRGVYEIISSYNKAIENVDKGYRLVYMGKTLELK
ncbi:MAG: NAD-binding protein, partial [Aestuariibaculum sp.]